MVKNLPSTAYKPGTSGNLSGRPAGFKGVAKLIGNATGDGKELVDWALAIWRDASIPLGARWDAFQWLSLRYLGTPVAMVQAEVTTPRDERAFSKLDADQLARIDAVFREAAGLPLIDVTAIES